jgi:hypothetical protein
MAECGQIAVFQENLLRFRWKFHGTDNDIGVLKRRARAT